MTGRVTGVLSQVFGRDRPEPCELCQTPLVSVTYVLDDGAATRTAMRDAATGDEHTIERCRAARGLSIS